jgi:hypothetical protein
MIKLFVRKYRQKVDVVPKGIHRSLVLRSVMRLRGDTQKTRHPNQMQDNFPLNQYES